MRSDPEYVRLAARFRRGDTLTPRDLEQLRQLAAQNQNVRLVEKIDERLRERTA